MIVFSWAMKFQLPWSILLPCGIIAALVLLAIVGGSRRMKRLCARFADRPVMQKDAWLAEHFPDATEEHAEVIFEVAGVFAKYIGVDVTQLLPSDNPQVDYSADGSSLIVKLGEDSDVDCLMQEILEMVQSRAGRQLTDEECENLPIHEFGAMIGEILRVLDSNGEKA